nr:MAG TPA: hypothetical protein [Caudoviricetes sp.]DAS23214.1 MAG TPA: hypothetical protein [Caudoviricetes sp.]
MIIILINNNIFKHHHVILFLKYERSAKYGQKRH